MFIKSKNSLRLKRYLLKGGKKKLFTLLLTKTAIHHELYVQYSTILNNIVSRIGHEIKNNIQLYRNKYGDNIPIDLHPKIRSEEACFLSSSFAVELAKKYNSRLHVLHISTAKEIALFENKTPLEKKKITAEDNGRVLIVPYKDDSTYDQIIDATIKSKCPLYEMERTSQSMDSVYQEIIK